MTLASSTAGIGAVIGVFLVAGAYFLPSVVVVTRGVRDQVSIIVVNLFLGWTLIGWVIVLAMACRTSRMDKP